MVELAIVANGCRFGVSIGELSTVDSSNSVANGCRFGVSIRDSGSPKHRLYRRDYETFEDYCRGRWGMSDRHAHRMIEAACVVEELKNRPMGQFLPTSERQARELAKLESPEQRAEVWQEIVTEAEEAELQNRAAESRLRTQRWLGQMLAETNPHGANQHSRTSHDDRSTLHELGISYSDSSRWQTAASLPDEDFEQFVTETKEAGKELTAAAVYRLAKRRRRTCDRLPFPIR